MDLVIAPILAATAAAILALVADISSADPGKSRRWAAAVVLAGLLAATGLALAGSLTLEGGTVVHGVFIGGGGLSAAIAAAMLVGSLAVLGGFGELASREGGGSAAALIAFGAAAAAALASSVDLVMTVIALEGLALTAYALVAGARSSNSDEAAMKYLVQGAVATGLLLLGVAVLVGVYGGARSYVDLGTLIAGGSPLVASIGAALVLSAIAFKLGAVPFHSWAPDVFETAPRAVAAFLSGAPKIAALSAAFILTAQFFETTVENLALQVGVIAGLSVIVGNLAALRQTSYTRMLGYSGIAQIGYALTGLAVGVALGQGGVGALLPMTLVLVIAYSLAATGAFIAAWAVERVRPGWDGTIAGMAGIGRERPLLGLGLGVCLFSLTGIPLTAGFWGKLLVFGVATRLGGWMALAIIGVVGSVVSFGYYGAVLRSVFFDTHSDTGESDGRADRMAEVSLGICAVLVLAAGILPLLTGLDSLVALLAG